MLDKCDVLIFVLLAGLILQMSVCKQVNEKYTHHKFLGFLRGGECYLAALPYLLLAIACYYMTVRPDIKCNSRVVMSLVVIAVLVHCYVNGQLLSHARSLKSNHKYWTNLIYSVVIGVLLVYSCSGGGIMSASSSVAFEGQ